MITKKEVSQEDLKTLAGLAREGITKLEACSQMADELMEVEDKNHDWAVERDECEFEGTLGVLLDYQCRFEETLHILTGLSAHFPAEEQATEEVNSR